MDFNPSTIPDKGRPVAEFFVGELTTLNAGSGMVRQEFRKRPNRQKGSAGVRPLFAGWLFACCVLVR